jgi:hypothetical protein
MGALRHITCSHSLSVSKDFFFPCRKSRKPCTTVIFRFLLLPAISGHILGECLHGAYSQRGMMRRKLTPAFVNDVEGGDTSQIYWDTELRGFGLLVPPSDEKRYVIQYRALGRSRRMSKRRGRDMAGTVESADDDVQASRRQGRAGCRHGAPHDVRKRPHTMQRFHGAVAQVRGSPHKSREAGAKMYFARLMIAHMFEALKVVNKINTTPELKEAVERCERQRRMRSPGP